jgi:serine protease Do
MTIFETISTPTSITLELAAVAEKLRRSTVQVRSDRLSAGSGVIWNCDGLIITNAHVAPKERASVELNDGRVFEAVVTTKDSQRDLAALQVEATDLPAATIGNSDTLRVGELVMAVGNPLGVVGALATGIIHATSSQKWVMADVCLLPGNSGGLLANAQGQVIGINTMIADGLALAVPSKVVERFLKGERAPKLGVTLQPVLVNLENKRVLGLLILEVEAESSAIEAGFQIGDVLIRVCGQFFNTPNDLLSAIEYTEPGELLPLEFLRGGKHLVSNVLLHGGTSGVKAA